MIRTVLHPSLSTLCSSGVKSESLEAMTISSGCLREPSRSMMSRHIRMSAAFLLFRVRGGQSTTSKPARTKNGRNRER